MATVIKKHLGWFVLLALAAPALALAGVVWVTADDAQRAWSVNKSYLATATADTDGNAIGTTVVHGFVVRAVTLPSAIASTRPTAAFDCTLLDQDGVDVMGGSMGDRINTWKQIAYPLTTANQVVWARVDGALTLNCSNMGTTRETQVRIYVQE
jgi:hypothetical protein